MLGFRKRRPARDAPAGRADPIDIAAADASHSDEERGGASMEPTEALFTEDIPVHTEPEMPLEEDEDRPELRTVIVRSFSGEGTRVRVLPTETILQLKIKVSRLTGLSRQSQELFCTEKEEPLLDSDTIEESLDGVYDLRKPECELIKQGRTTGGEPEIYLSVLSDPLSQHVGQPPPQGDWKKEIIEASKEGLKNNGYLTEDVAWVQSFEAWVQSRQNSIQVAEGIGWSNEEAILTEACYNQYSGNAIGCAIAQSSNRYASLTHAAYNALARKAEQAEITPRCYRGLLNLSRRDKTWSSSSLSQGSVIRINGPTVATLVDEHHYSNDGMKVWQGGQYVVEDSDVVCFLGAAPDDAGLHSGVKVGPKDFMFPPLTEFKVVRIAESFEMLPGKTVNRRLIVVMPTFHLPIRPAESSRIKYLQVSRLPVQKSI
jgi:hypothetical protein